MRLAGELHAAIRKVATEPGHVVLSVTARLFEVPEVDNRVRLSHREVQILSEAADALSNRQIRSPARRHGGDREASSSQHFQQVGSVLPDRRGQQGEGRRPAQGLARRRRNYLPERQVVAMVQSMDEDTARQQAAEARDAFRHSSRPPLALVPSLASALAAGVGVALWGASPSSGWVRAGTFVTGLLLVTVAFAVPNMLRKRSGLYGHRGQVKRENTVFLLCGVVLVMSGMSTPQELGARAIFVGVGAFVTIMYFLLLRGRFGAPSWEPR